MDDDTLENNAYFTFSYNQTINGPILATAVGLEIILGLTTNLLVLIFSLCHPKILKLSSNIFLTNFVLGNLVIVILYMPTVIVTIATGEWVFGETTKQKDISCHFFGFIFAQSIFLSVFTLTAISFDRFLFIVKPFIHKRFMKTWVAAVIVIILWAMSIILCIPPFFGINRYAFSPTNAACIPSWDSTSNTVYLVCTVLVVTTCIAIIAVTSLWTFCFTHNYIKRLTPLSNTSNDQQQKHVYNSRIRKILGIFGAMLIVTAITYAPGLIVCIVGLAITFERLPRPLFTSITVLFYTVTISNPIIQSYFRRELNIFVVSTYKKVVCFFKKSHHPGSVTDKRTTSISLSGNNIVVSVKE